ncbi:MAG: type II secretion system F family protein [Chloroflexota bacterium]
MDLPFELTSNLVPLIGAGVAFIIVFSFFALLARGAGGPDVTDRLTQYGGRSGARDDQQPGNLAKIDAAFSKGKQGSQIARKLSQADLKLTVLEYVGIKILCAIAGAAVGAIIGRANLEAQIVSALVGGILLSFGPDIYVSFAAKRRVKAFNDQLGDTINLLANSLRSGYSFLQSMELVSREAPAPMSSEFRRVVQEVSLGLSTEAALDNLMKRVPSEDLDLLITAVNIQHEVGGNLAQILDTIGHTIRERVRIKGEIRVLTAQGRISAYVITGLPIALAIFITVINPDYMSPIFTFGLPPDAWCCLPVASLIMIVIGFFAIMKIVDIEV